MASVLRPRRDNQAMASPSPEPATGNVIGNMENADRNSVANSFAPHEDRPLLVEIPALRPSSPQLQIRGITNSRGMTRRAKAEQASALN